MRKILFYILISIGFVSGINAQTHSAIKKEPHTKWTTDPFDHQIFIENKGQFDKEVATDKKILFQARLGDVKAYFTPSGVLFRYDEPVKKGEDPDDKDGDTNDHQPQFTSYSWVNSSPAVEVSGEEERSDFYSYPTGVNTIVRVNIFNKIIYKNIYPNVDIEYSFIKGKPGLKYSVIIHPGASVADVQLAYNDVNKIHITPKGDAIVKTNVGDITDMAPVSYYKSSNHHVKSSYKIINGNIETFKVNIDGSETGDLIIDPFSTNPNFTAGYDQAYDVDFDLNGNVYAYGSYNPFQLVKMNSSGIIQWTFSASTISGSNYGDFAVDRVTGTSYIGEGALNTGARILKVNTTNTSFSTFAGSASVQEIWRMIFNPCTRQIVMGTGGAGPAPQNKPTSQACMLDTSLTAMTGVNSLSTTDGYHDVCLMTLDPNGGTAYFGIAQNSINANFDNTLYSVPVPALTPPAYTVNDGFGFLEGASVAYLSAGFTNGMNGMAASPNFLYTYDGDTLKKVNKASGAVLANKVIGNQAFSWGGLDADECDNVYVGENSAVQIYSSAFALIKNIPLKNTVYDVVLGANNNIIYACGNGFVSSTDITGVTNTINITNSITPSSCGSCNGSATANVLVCGSAPTGTPTYSWSPGGQTTQTATGLCSGSYTVTINLGCEQILTDTLTIVPATGGTVSLVKAQTNITCNGSANGSASVTASGGTGPYTYSWAPSGGTSSASTPLGPGTYTVTVNDANCDQDTAIFTITQPPLLRDSISAIVPVKCFGGSGSITVGVTGGVSPYTYSWNSTPVQTNATATNLAAGSYTVNITDAHGCPATANGTIIQPSQIRDSIVSSVAPACGKTNGSITIGVKDGTPAYTYSWNSAPVQTNAMATNLGAGTYTCVVTDANGCKDSASLNLTNPSGPRDSIVSTSSISCNGGSNGSIVLGVNRGTTPYTFAWSNSATTQNIGGLSAGTYSVTVTDANGCTATASAVIKQPPAIRDSLIDSTEVLCFGGNNGIATVGVKGGTPGAGYTFSWNTAPVQTTATATGLKAGMYICTIKDANGCISILDVTITQPNKLTLVAAAFPVTCNGLCNGSAAVIPKGGTTPYTYSWNTNPTSGSPSPTGLCAGTYNVQVTDNNGCTADSNGLVVSQPAPLAITKNTITSSHCGQTDGSITITVSGGTTPYKYLWSNNSTNQNLTNAIPGSYCVTVTDANSCTDTACATINNVPSPVVIITGQKNVTCNGGNNGSATATANGGAAPYKYQWSPGTTADTNAVINGLTAGQYTITVTDSGGCVSTAIATITQPALVVTTVNTPAAICIGGSATLNANTIGGTPPYTYTWSNGATGSSITVSPITTTTYAVTSTLDSNGCPGKADTVTVTVNPPLKLNVTAKPDTICLGNSAILSANASGGDGSYTYLWQPGGYTGSPVTVTPTTNTVYTVIVKDNCGTPADTDSVSIVIEPSPVVKFIDAGGAGCYPHCMTFISQSKVPGGTISSVAWNFGDGGTGSGDTAKHCYDTSGNYTVGLTITTNIGCVDSLVKPNLVTVYSHPVAAFTATPDPTTTANDNICFTNGSTDAYGIKSYLWKFNDHPGDSTDTAKNPCYEYHDSGTYCPKLYVTNIHGCVDSVTHCIDISPYFTFYIPNAFSPDGDGLNDVFSPKGMFVCDYEMYIFDRWGMLLYYTNDMNQGWNGTVNGGENIVQEDTYVYLITLKDCPTHTKHTYLGKVSVVK